PPLYPGTLATSDFKPAAVANATGRRRRFSGELPQAAAEPALRLHPDCRGENGLVEGPALPLCLNSVHGTAPAARPALLSDPGGSTLGGILRILEERCTRGHVGALGFPEPAGRAVAASLIGVAGTARSLEYPFPVSDPFFAPPQINLHGSV